MTCDVDRQLERENFDPFYEKAMGVIILAFSLQQSSKDNL
jgi:hypothetical protein